MDFWYNMSMQKIVNFLFNVDHKIMNNWFVQVLLLLSVLLGLKSLTLWFSLWVGLGFVSYLYLTYKGYKENKQYQQEMKKTYLSHGALPFLKGLNYCLTLGPLASVVSHFVNKD